MSSYHFRRLIDRGVIRFNLRLSIAAMATLAYLDGNAGFANDVGGVFNSSSNLQMGANGQVIIPQQPSGNPYNNNSAGGVYGNPQQRPPESSTVTDEEWKDTRRARAETDYDYRRAPGKADAGDCKVSTTIDAKYSCKSTETLGTTATVTNVAGQALGASATQVYGGMATMDAQRSGTQAAALEASASTTRMAGGSQLALGSANIGMAVMQIMNSRGHDENAKLMRQSAEQSAIEEAKRKNLPNQSGQKENEDGYVAATADIAKEIVKRDINYDGAEGNKSLNEKITIEKLTDGEYNALYKNIPDPKKPGVSLEMQQKEAWLKTQKRDAMMRDKENKIRSQVRSTANRAAGEQEGMSKTAMTHGITGLIQGVTQTANGMFSMMSASQLEAAAKKLQNTSNGANFQLDTGTMTPGQDSFNRGATSVNPGTATDPVIAEEDGNLPGTGGIGDLGTPIDPNANEGVLANTPPPGKFAPGIGEKAAGGAGGNIGVGSTTAAKGDDPDPAPRAAENRANTAYNIGAAGGYVTGGVGADRGMDLSALAQFLPKPEEQKGKHGIEEYGNRGPASVQPYSLLGRNVNLFQRVHDRNQEKQKQGTVGI